MKTTTKTDICSHRYKEGCSCGDHAACKDCGHSPIKGRGQEYCHGNYARKEKWSVIRKIVQ